MSVEIEYKVKDGVWGRVKVKVTPTRNNNLKFRHDGKIYVIQGVQLREGASVYVIQGEDWIKVGRVTRGLVFLGEGESYAEYRCRMPLTFPRLSVPHVSQSLVVFKNNN